MSQLQKDIKQLRSANQRGELAQCKPFLMSLLEEHPDNYNLKVLHASLLQQERNHNAAFKLWSSLSEQSPADGFLKLKQLKSFEQLKKSDEVLLAYDKAIASFPATIQIKLSKARFLKEQNRLSEATAYLDQLSPEVTTDESRILLCNLLIEDKRFARAQEVLSKVSSESPSFYKSLIKLLETGEKKNTCFLKIKEAQGLFPKQFSFLMSEANWYLQQFEFEKALKPLERLLEENPEHILANLSLISCFIELGQKKQATDKLLRLSEHDKYTARPMFYKLCAKAFLGDDEAWSTMATKMMDGQLSKSFILKYVSILENSNLTDQAFLFLDSILENDDLTLGIQVACLYEQRRLSALLSMSSGLEHEVQETTFHFKMANHILTHASDESTKSWVNLNVQLLSQLSLAYESLWDSKTQPLVALTIAYKIVAAIRNKTPLSLIRLGDGEGNFMDYACEWESYQLEDQKDIQKIWWGQAHLHETPLQVEEHYNKALDNADLIGIPEYQRMLSKVNIYEEGIEKPYKRYTRGLLAINEFVAVRIGDTSYSTKTLVSCFIHQDLDLWGLYDFILDAAGSCSVITCHETMPAVISERFNLEVDQTYLIPTEYRWGSMFKNVKAECHFPERYKALKQELKVNFPGELFLVGAGFLGKIYCDLIKQQGGIALDIGSIFDYWLGYETREAMSINTNLDRLACFYESIEEKKGLQSFLSQLEKRTMSNVANSLSYYWINLATDGDRKERCIAQFADKGLSHKRIKGLRPEHLESIIDGEYSRAMRPGEYGCLASHFKLYRQALLDQQPVIVVMEDDCVIPQAIDLEALIASAPADWEILQLYTNQVRVLKNLDGYYKQGQLWKEWEPQNFWTTLHYLIKPAAAQRLLTKYNQDPNVLDLSTFKGYAPVADCLLYSECKTYTLTFPIVYSAPAKSNIVSSNETNQLSTTNYIKKRQLLSN